MATLPPTKSNLLATKHSRELAETGYELMDKKRNLLIRELVALMEQAKDLQERVETVFAEAYDALSRATISMGGSIEIENVARLSIPHDESIVIRYRSVMGVELPTVYASSMESDTVPYGLLSTTSALDEAYVKFKKAKQLVLDLAGTENAIFRLAFAIKKTQKRVNALKNIVIPGLDETTRRITDELEEKEREEFVRQKVIKIQRK
jgi:H(+)-transporting ATP synthase, vacuolar type, subunit D